MADLCQLGLASQEAKPIDGALKLKWLELAPCPYLAKVDGTNGAQAAGNSKKPRQMAPSPANVEGIVGSYAKKK